jgi:hypothetical protein
VIELTLYGSQASFDIAKALAVGQLREAQAQKLIPTRKSVISEIAAVTAYTFPEFVGGQVRHHLREDRSAKIHAPLSGDTVIYPRSSWEIRGIGQGLKSIWNFQIEKFQNTI